MLISLFKTCSIQVTTTDVAALYATIANGGVIPGSERRIVSEKTCQDILALMLSCGMYDYSGEAAYTIGQPAKSGISGCIALVVPRKFALCVYSPRIDSYGNSVRGIEVLQRVVKKFQLHGFSMQASGVWRSIHSQLAIQGLFERCECASVGSCYDLLY